MTSEGIVRGVVLLLKTSEVQAGPFRRLRHRTTRTSSLYRVTPHCRAVTPPSARFSTYVTLSSSAHSSPSLQCLSVIILKLYFKKHSIDSVSELLTSMAVSTETCLWEESGRQTLESQDRSERLSSSLDDGGGSSQPT